MTTTTLSIVETFIGHWVTIIKAHEKLLLAIILSLVLWHFGDKAYDAYGQHLKNNVTADNAQITSLQQSTAKIESDLATLTATVAAKSAADDAKIANAKQTIIAKEKEVAAMPMPELAKEWQSVLVLPEGSITPQANGTVAVTPDAAHTTVSELEKVGPLTDQLIATNDKLDGCNSVVAQQTKDITSVKETLAAETKARTDDAAVAKTNERKSFWKGTKWGAGLTAVGLTLLKIALVVK